MRPVDTTASLPHYFSSCKHRVHGCHPEWAREWNEITGRIEVTKRKAIEAACRCECNGDCERGCTGRAWPEVAAERAFIAGFRACIALLPDWGLIRAGETKRRLRAEANAMAKKARRK